MRTMLIIPKLQTRPQQAPVRGTRPFSRPEENDPEKNDQVRTLAV